MKKNSLKFDWGGVRRALPYAVVALITLVVAGVGTHNKLSSDVELGLNQVAGVDDTVSVDQLSELYIVADISDALGLASATDVASSYVVANSMYTSGQTVATSKFEKPNITDVQASRGVLTYTVKDGDTMESIAAEYGLSTDQVRWSNGLKTTAVTPGDTLYLPSSSGIVYQVAAGDTIESIASKYGSSVEEITTLNDLELSGISEGMRIVVKGGSLPETERPEYVAPVVTRPRYTQSTYTYLGNSAERLSIVSIGAYYGLGGPYGAGQCTQWAWHMRPDLPGNLGNASSWAYMAQAQGFAVDHRAAPGAIFQTSGGWYGHVGYVEAVNADGSIVVTEMNYGGVPYRVVRSVIPAGVAAVLNYIH